MFSPKHKKRMAMAIGALILCASVVGVLLMTLQDNVQLYFTPTAISKGEAPVNRPIRMGGMVVKGSVQRGEGVNLRFQLTDGASEIWVNYAGALPDLFREGQGIVAMGTLSSANELRAVQVLAKHDENYMPKEVSASLRATSLRGGVADEANQSKAWIASPSARKDGGNKNAP